MSKDTTHLIASALFLLALVLIVLGLGNASPALWHAGLAAVAAGMGFALATRWVGEEEERAKGAADRERTDEDGKGGRE